jgi:hypothetical protein
MALCRSDEVEPWDGRDQTVAFREREMALCRSEEVEPWDGSDQTVVFREREMALCRSEEVEPWDGRDCLSFRWLSPFVKHVQKVFQEYYCQSIARFLFRKY